MTEYASTLSLYLMIIFITATYILVLYTKKVLLWKAVSGELPHQLNGALLFYNEQPLMIELPIKLFGRTDQIWERTDGMLVVTDTKKRKIPRYYRSDQIQLTGYAFLLKHHPATQGRKIAPFGFIRIHADPAPQFLKVPLLTEDEFMELYEHHNALVRRTRRPAGSNSPLICRNCGHSKRCLLTLLKTV